ncbi:MAG: dTMP kinase [Pasteurella sp.]|nr:dTMP kinase [Pasteurella sp.]
MTTKGKFIVIEGLEGAGKTNAQQIIMASLQAQNIEFITTREPGGTPIAEALRNLWKKGIGEEHTTDKAELLMLYAARTQLVETIIQPALEKGIWVIGDRHDMSTQAYQGGGRELSDELLTSIKTAILGNFKPDLTLYLDLDPRIGLERAKGRGELDRIEQQHIDFFHRTRTRYLQLIENNPNAVIIDAEQPLEEVSDEIKTKFEIWLTEN